MRQHLEDARLLTIAPDKNFRSLQEEPLDFFEAYPKIKTPGLEPGYYSLMWSYIHLGTGPFINLELMRGLPGQDTPAERVNLSPFQFCSYGEVLYRVKKNPQEAPMMLQAMKTLFNGRADPDPYAMASHFTGHQIRAFSDRMNEWIDFSSKEGEQALEALRLKLSAYFSACMRDVPLGARAVQLPSGYDPLRPL